MDDLKKKVMAMLAKAGDPAASEAEAASALTMARRLMDKHGLSEEDMQNATGDDFVESTWAGRYSKKHGNIFHPVDRLLGRTISRYAGVRYWYSRPPGERDMVAVFFGLEVDVNLAEWMRATLVEQFDRDWETYWYIDCKNKARSKLAESRISFANGFANAIKERFEGWLQSNADAVGKDGYDNALVLTKQDVVNAEMERRGISLKTKMYSGARVTDGIAAGAGYNAGKAAQLGAGIYSGRPQLQIGFKGRR